MIRKIARWWGTRRLIDEHGMWGSHSAYPVEQWVSDVDNYETRLGYWDAVWEMTR
jgi:hypothetical protein